MGKGEHVGRRPTVVSDPGTGEDAGQAKAWRNRTNHFELAYDRIESLIVTCALKPGQVLALQDLQDLTGLGRTPVHQAVTRFAADTLIIIRPRHGLQIAPIDLARERVLLALRADLERFVIRLAAERSGASHRNQMLHLQRSLRERRDVMDIDEFNLFDRRLDGLILAVAGEPFLEHALRPLHTLSRRIGWIHYAQLKEALSLQTTIDCHLAVLEAVANRHIERAIDASDKLIAFVDSMFDVMEREIDPSLLDCSIQPIKAR
ncbi:MAG TPA: GntR family transcriptional regulator [Aliidongia sp.]|nr:GntR family transcriptional regulator [Aliidongia sp.]